MLLKNVSLGMYYPGKSILHRLQARTKLLAVFWIVLSLIIANQHQEHFVPYIVVVALLSIGIILSGVSPREIWRRMWLLVLLIALGAIPTLFATGVDDKPLYPLGPLMTSYGTVHNVLLVASIILIIYICVSFLPWLRPLRGIKLSRIPAVIATIAALVSLWLINGPSSSQPLAIGPLIITHGGVWVVVTAFVALLVLYTSSLLLTMTTTPVALIEGLTMLMSPLRRLKLPVDDFALMTLLALRFFPTLIEEAEQLTKAQASRGADLANGPIRDRLQSLATLFIPLIQGVLRRAADLATALEARGHHVEGRQTMLHETTLSRLDYVVLGVVVLTMIGALLI